MRYYTVQEGRTHWRIDTKPDTVGNILVEGSYVNKAQGKRSFHPIRFGSYDSAITHYKGLNVLIGGFQPLISKLEQLRHG